MPIPSQLKRLADDPPGRAGWALMALGLLIGAPIGVYRAVYGISDFRGFYDGAEIAWTQHRLSTHELVTRYPFTFHALLAPLGALPVAWATAIWNLLNVAAICHLPWLFERLSGVSLRRQLAPWLILFPLTFDNLVLGQSAPLLMWMATAGLVWSREERSVRGGAILGLAMCIKVIPAVFFVVPWTRRKILGTIGGGLLAVALATLIGGILVGFGVLWPNTVEWWRYGTKGHTLEVMFGSPELLKYNNQSLASILARTFGDITAPAKHGVRLASFSLDTIRLWVRLLTAPALLAGLAVVWKIRRSQKPMDWLGLYALIAVGMLLVSPIVWTHYFLWLAPALIFFADRSRILIASLALCWGGLALPPARALGVHMVWALGLFGLIAWEMIRRVDAPEPAPPPPAPQPVAP